MTILSVKSYKKQQNGMHFRAQNVLHQKNQSKVKWRGLVNCGKFLLLLQHWKITGRHPRRAQYNLSTRKEKSQTVGGEKMI